MKENKLRNLIKKGETSIGTRVCIVWPGLTEILGCTGLYDYIEFLGEYAPYSQYDLDNFSRAAELFEMSTMIKLDREPKGYLAGRSLASGIQNFLFADIKNVNDAEEAVRAVRTEPRGLSGFRMDRRIGYVGCKGTEIDVVNMCNEAIVALMIERKLAVESLEDILSVEGIDMVQFGPSDYSISIGLPGDTDNPKVREAEIKTIKTALEMGVTPRAEISSPEDAKKYLELGVSHFSLNTDIDILYNWWKNKGEELKRIITKISKN